MATKKDTVEVDKLQEGIDKINKMFGEGSIMTGNTIIEVDKISTGSIKLDMATGGGYGKGKVVEIFGPESSGKTTLCLHAIKEAQSKGGIAAFIDAEHAFDKSYAESLGVDTEKLLFAQPDNGEQAFDICTALIETDKISLIIMDSVAALQPKAVLDGAMDAATMGAHARLMSKGVTKIVGKASKHGTTVILINQLREKIGVIYGSNETTTGGNTLKFYASTRIDIRKQVITSEKSGTDEGYNIAKCKVVKNKLSAPFKKCELKIAYGIGVDQVAEVLDLSSEMGIVEKKGSWYYYSGSTLGGSYAKALDTLRDNPDLVEELRTKVLEMI